MPNKDPSDPVEYDTFYMAVALLSAKRSKDDDRQNGACIVDETDDRIISIGYNGMPLNCRDDLMPWKGKKADESRLKKLYVVHAEMNAIVSMTPQSVAKGTMYTTVSPCLECCKMICTSGIKKVYYLKKQNENSANETDPVQKCTGVRAEKLDLPEIAINGHKIYFGKDTVSMCESNPITWEQYFMGIAILAMDLKSEGTEKQKEGACIVNEDKRIVGIGYLQQQHSKTELKHMVHAPLRAIVNKNPVSVRDCTIYVTCFPCNECAKVIVQSGIKTVVYLCEHDTKAKYIQDKVNSSRGKQTSDGHGKTQVGVIRESQTESSNVKEETQDKQEKAVGEHRNNDEPADSCEESYTKYEKSNSEERISQEDIKDAVEKMFSLARVRYVSYSHYDQSQISLSNGSEVNSSPRKQE